MNNKAKSLIGNIVRDTTYKFYGLKNQGLVGKYLEWIYSKLMSLAGLSYFPIISSQKYQELTGNVSLTIVETNRIGFEGNVLFADDEYLPVKTQQPLPDIRLHVYNDVFITGDSDIIVDKKRGFIICDTCYDIAQEVLFVDGLLYRDKLNVGVLRNNMKNVNEHISSGIMISGKFSKNYYHSITENLVRMIVFNDLDIPFDIPFLIDESVWSIPSLKRIFHILNENNKRNAICLNSQKVYNVDKLYFVDHVNKIAPHIKSVALNKPTLVIYDEKYMKRMRDVLLEKKADILTPKRVFLTRKKTVARHFNEEEVFSVLEPLGFAKVAPEEYSFDEQMTLFNSAECIIGGTGAAFTNLLFCSKNCIIIVFRSVENKNELPYFANLAYLNNSQIVYFLPSHTDHPSSIHSDYYIDIESFGDYLKSRL